MSFLEFIEACDQDENVDITHVICSSEKMIHAKYVKYPYTMDSLKLLFSVTKSFSSLAIGIASDQRLLDIEDPIAKYFKNELPQAPDENLNCITIRHLLTMTSGIHENTYAELFAPKNWVTAFLRQSFPHQPGTYYRYSTHGSHLLSAILTKASGLSLEDFLNQYLFYPMGIFEAQWEQAPEGLTAGGMGLSLYPLSLVKIAQMLLNRGVYQGKRMLSAQYLDLATTAQIQKQEDGRDSPDCFSGMHYGFQFHIGKDGFYRMDGAFGQLCLLCPSKKMAVVVFSRKAKMESLLSLVYRHLLGDAPFSGGLYEAKPARKNMPQPRGLPCGQYRLERNDAGIEALGLLSIGDEYELRFCKKGATDRIRFSLWHDTKRKINFIKDLQEHLQESVCIAEYDRCLQVQVFLIETPYVLSFKLSFDNKKINLDFSGNIGFSFKEFSVKGVLQEENPTDFLCAGR